MQVNVLISLNCLGPIGFVEPTVGWLWFSVEIQL